LKKNEVIVKKGKVKSFINYYLIVWD